MKELLLRKGALTLEDKKRLEINPFLEVAYAKKEGVIRVYPKITRGTYASFRLQQTKPIFFGEVGLSQGYSSDKQIMVFNPVKNHFKDLEERIAIAAIGIGCPLKDEEISEEERAAHTPEPEQSSFFSRGLFSINSIIEEEGDYIIYDSTLTTTGLRLALYSNKESLNNTKIPREILTDFYLAIDKRA